MIKIVKRAEVDGPRGEAGGKRHGVFAYCRGSGKRYQPRRHAREAEAARNNDDGALTMGAALGRAIETLARTATTITTTTLQ